MLVMVAVMIVFELELGTEITFNNFVLSSVAINNILPATLLIWWRSMHFQGWSGADQDTILATRGEVFF